MIPLIASGVGKGVKNFVRFALRLSISKIWAGYVLKVNFAKRKWLSFHHVAAEYCGCRISWLQNIIYKKNIYVQYRGQMRKTMLNVED